MDDVSVMSQNIQYGFAGFAFAMLSILATVLVWLSRSLLTELRDSNKQKETFAGVVANNTAAITALTKTSDGTMDLMIEVKDLLLARPCIISGEKNGDGRDAVRISEKR